MPTGIRFETYDEFKVQDNSIQRSCENRWKFILKKHVFRKDDNVKSANNK